MAGGIDDSHVILGGLELPQGDVDSDTLLPGGLDLVHDPGELERALVGFVSLLLQLLQGPLLDATTHVNKVAGGGRLSSIDVADDDDVQVRLVVAHVSVFCLGKRVLNKVYRSGVD